MVRLQSPTGRPSHNLIIYCRLESVGMFTRETFVFLCVVVLVGAAQVFLGFSLLLYRLPRKPNFSLASQ